MALLLLLLYTDFVINFYPILPCVNYLCTMAREPFVLKHITSYYYYYMYYYYYYIIINQLCIVLKPIGPVIHYMLIDVSSVVILL